MLMINSNFIRVADAVDYLDQYDEGKEYLIRLRRNVDEQGV